MPNNGPFHQFHPSCPLFWAKLPFCATLQAMGDAQLQQFVGPRGRLEVAPPEAQAAGGAAWCHGNGNSLEKMGQTFGNPGENHA